ncbi:hypothetical protein E2P81_ATG03105 [Venturia nashicola]|nr:hypothetical protein E2P81_ATG03105 [Venturia nashicola]
MVLYTTMTQSHTNLPTPTPNPAKKKKRNDLCFREKDQAERGYGEGVTRLMWAIAQKKNPEITRGISTNLESRLELAGEVRLGVYEKMLVNISPFWTTSPSNSITEETKRFAFAPTIVTYPIVWIVDCGLRITGYGVEEHTRITCGSDTPRSARGISWSYNPHCGGRALFIAGAHAHAHAHGSVLGGVPSTLIDKS